ncbi:chorismate transformation enzyme, FkbO/Hyg5 family [Aquariibacter albus]|uniref:Chorismatase FkbO/Hyg5-like N-terminal domain-containing protein n=1 Tax=Aquariibacter albus TaxID=2759899 RepID=A0A839HNQ0_9BURK|nr:hypothetical protein [Aquariibacter albus]MBB1161060.1 hypothetical protein [Aquariibacter albus]
MSSDSLAPVPAPLSGDAFDGPDRAAGGLGWQRVAAGQALPPGWSLLAERLIEGQEARDRAEPARLGGGGACVERWLHAGPVQRAQLGCWTTARCADGWLATATLDEAAEPGGLQAATERLYRELFGLLDAEAAAGRVWHLLKIWNYLADINGSDPADGQDGLERYRQFNVGRRLAYAQARRSASDRVPAACALGTHHGPLTVHVLAGPQPPVPVENPRQTRAYHYPSDYGPRSPIFARAALAELGGGREGLLISGTAAIVGHASLHAGRADKQAATLLDNLESVWLAAQIDARAPHRWADLALTLYLRDPADQPAVAEALARRFPADSPALRGALYLHADICRAELLVEVEAQQITRGA